jgi:hypothetical protein
MESPSHSKQVEIQGDTAWLPGGRALVNMQGFEKPHVTTTSPLFKPGGVNAPKRGVIPWGLGNDHPQQVIKKVSQSPETLSLLEFYYTALYGDGLVAEVPSGQTDKHGNMLYKTCNEPEILDWIELSNLPEWFFEACMDATYFGNTFEELIKSKDSRFITQINHQESAFARYRQRTDSGIITDVIMNANWPQATADDEYSVPVSLIDRYDALRIEKVRASNKMKFMHPVSFSSPGKVDYQSPGWQSILESAWYDVSISVPLYKKALMRNQMTIKYHIEVPFGFWVTHAKWRLEKDWMEMPPEEKKALQKVILDEMNEFLSNIDNTGKSFISTYGINPHDGKEVEGVKIKTIDDKLKDGAYLEDSQEASAHIIRSLGLTPAVVGHFTGKGMGAGSGSDARIHMNILNNRLAPRRHSMIQPLEFVARFNGWKDKWPGFRWRAKEITLETLDKSHQTTNKESYGQAA